MGSHARAATGRRSAIRAAVLGAVTVASAVVAVGVGAGSGHAATAAPASTPAGSSGAASVTPRPARSTAPRPASVPAASRSAVPAPAAAPQADLVPGTPCTAAAKACVELSSRRSWLLEDGEIIRGPVPVMTGDRDDPTPVGTFHVQWKAEQYTSREYLTQMPYSVFFADGGIAFHEGRQDTYSAGCVKLRHDDAVAWFDYLQVGDEVQIR